MPAAVPTVKFQHHRPGRPARADPRIAGEPSHEPPWSPQDRAPRLVTMADACALLDLIRHMERFYDKRALREDLDSVLCCCATADDRGAIVKTCGSRSFRQFPGDHPRQGRSMGFPLIKVGPARPTATRCGALTLRQRAWACVADRAWRRAACLRLPGLRFGRQEAGAGGASGTGARCDRLAPRTWSANMVTASSMRRM